MKRSIHKATIEMDLIDNVDLMRQAYMKFACLPGSGYLTWEFSHEQTPLWHLSQAIHKSLEEILGDEDLARACYECMMDSGESARYHIENYWMHLLHMAAMDKHWRRSTIQWGYGTCYECCTVNTEVRQCESDYLCKGCYKFLELNGQLPQPVVQSA